MGARGMLLQGERQKFLGEEWPRIHATIQRLGLKADELLNGSRPPSKTALSKPAKPGPSKPDPSKEER
jgi:hypothetical protein